MDDDFVNLFTPMRHTLGVLLIVSGLSKIFYFSILSSRLEGFGLPMAKALIVLGALIELLGALLLLWHLQMRWVSLGLAFYFLLVIIFVDASLLNGPFSQLALTPSAEGINIFSMLKNLVLVMAFWGFFRAH